MYTKTTAACSEIGKHIIQKNFWTLHLGLPFFPFPSWTSDWNTFTPALSISLQWIAYLLSLNQKCRYCSGKNSQTDVCGTSANPCLYSDHSWQHHSFFKSLAINVAWNCDVFSPPPNGTSVWKSATVKVDRHIIQRMTDRPHDTLLLPHFIQTPQSAEGIFYDDTDTIPCSVLTSRDNNITKEFSVTFIFLIV